MARRAFALGVATLALAAAGWTIGRRVAAPGVAERAATLHVFGTIAELRLRGAPPARLDAAIAAAQRELDALHRELHPWEPGPLTALNASLAAGRTHETTAAIAALIADAKPLVAASGGTFDPGAGGLVALWGFHTSEWPARTAAPDAAALAAWRAAAPSLRDVHVDGAHVSSANRAVSLDFNAVAEGFAARRIDALLTRHGVPDALLNLGGDVWARGSAGARPWRVAVRDGADGVLATVDLGGGEALFVSGAYAKWREDGARRRPHVVDPRTGEPVDGVRVAAVLHADPVRADAAVTALLVAGAAGFDATAAALGVPCALLLAEPDALHVTTPLAARLVLQRTPARVVRVARDGGCSVSR